MKNDNKKINSYTQMQRLTVGVLLIVGLLVSCSSDDVLAVRERTQEYILNARKLRILTFPFHRPRLELTLRTLERPVAKDNTTDLINAAVPSRTVTFSALQQLMNKKYVSGNEKLTLPLNAATLQLKRQEACLQKLGLLALTLLLQGTDQVSDEQVQAIARSPLSPAKLVKIGLLQVSGLDQYKFPHRRIQEELAGRALARQLLSRNKHEQANVSKFVSEHKYESKYGKLFLFMAGEVSRRTRGVQGITKLLNLIKKDEQDLRILRKERWILRRCPLGLQWLIKKLIFLANTKCVSADEDQDRRAFTRLLLQLRVVHQWLRTASGQKATRGMAVLERKFQLLTSLEYWFSTALDYARKGDTPRGYKLLELLTNSLPTFKRVVIHAPGLLALLNKGAKDASHSVRCLAMKAIASLIQASPALAPSFIKH